MLNIYSVKEGEFMRATILILSTVLLFIPAISAAQMHGGGMHGGGSGQMMCEQHMTGQGMSHNMGMMCNMMKDMQQMMGGPMTPEQHQRMMDMMNQMGQMMQQMGGSMTPQIEQQQQLQLQEMQQRLNALKSQAQKQGPGQGQPAPAEHKH